MSNDGDTLARQDRLRRVGAGAEAVLGRLTDLLLPPLCLSCRSAIDGHGGLCPACWSRIDFITAPICDCLGTPLPYPTGGERTVSAAALADPPVFDRARAAACYSGAMRELVHGLKFKDRHEGLALFGRWLVRAGADVLDGADLLVPVPLNRLRLWRRRFNQSALLTDRLARTSGIPADPLALSRTRRTVSQVGLTIEQRRRNVAGAFAVPDRCRGAIAGRRVVLVDDVITTGATANACARALKRAGACRVDVLALARVVDPLRVGV